MLPPDELLRSGVVTLPGSCNNEGFPLVIFPAEGHALLEEQYSAQDLEELVSFYMGTVRQAARRKHGFTFLADLRTTSKEVMGKIVETLERLQKNYPGIVGAFYSVYPTSKDRQKRLLQLLGLKSSKKISKSPILTPIFVYAISELYLYIDRSQLTQDFGGSLKYNHNSWVEIMKFIIPLFEKCELALEESPTAHDHLSMLQEYEIPQPDENLDHVVEQLRTRYNDVMRDLNIEARIDECKGLIGKFKEPEKYGLFKDLHKNPHLKEGEIALQRYLNKLMQIRHELRSLWRNAEERLVKGTQHDRLRLQVEKITLWIEHVGNKRLSEPVRVGNSLSKAETYKTHFEASFYNSAKERLRLGEKLLERLVDTVRQETGDPTLITSLCKQLHTALKQISDALEQKHAIYIHIYHFFKLFLKCYLWYKQAIQILPVQLIGHHLNGHLSKVSVFHQSAEWTVTKRNFLAQHPVPQNNELHNLIEAVSFVKSTVSKNKSRILVHRIEVLSRLIENGTITRAELNEVACWQDDLLKGQNSISITVSESTTLEHFGLDCTGKVMVNRTPKLTGKRSQVQHMPPTAQHMDPTTAKATQKPDCTSRQYIDEADSNNSQSQTYLKSPILHNDAQMPTTNRDVHTPSNPASSNTKKGEESVSPMPVAKGSLTHASNNQTQPRPNTGTYEERYVSLGRSGKSSMPPSLNHVSLERLRQPDMVLDSSEQSSILNEHAIPKSVPKVTKKTPKHIESSVDSGIGPSQVLSSSDPSTINTKYRPPVSAILPSTSYGSSNKQPNPKRRYQFLPPRVIEARKRTHQYQTVPQRQLSNLPVSSKLTYDLEPNPENLDLILKSEDLTSERKLEMMAAMLDNDSGTSSMADSDLHSVPPNSRAGSVDEQLGGSRDVSDMHSLDSRNPLNHHNSIIHRVNPLGNRFYYSIARENQIQESIHTLYLSESHEMQIPPTLVHEFVQSPSLIQDDEDDNEDGDTDVGTLISPSDLSLFAKRNETNSVLEQNYVPPTRAMAPISSEALPSRPGSSLSLEYGVLLNYGIDIERWVKEQKENTTPPLDSPSEEEEDALYTAGSFTNENMKEPGNPSISSHPAHCQTPTLMDKTDLHKEMEKRLKKSKLSNEDSESVQLNELVNHLSDLLSTSEVETDFTTDMEFIPSQSMFKEIRKVTNPNENEPSQQMANEALMDDGDASDITLKEEYSNDLLLTPSRDQLQNEDGNRECSSRLSELVNHLSDLLSTSDGETDFTSDFDFFPLHTNANKPRLENAHTGLILKDSLPDTGEASDDTITIESSDIMLTPSGGQNQNRNGDTSLCSGVFPREIDRDNDSGIVSMTRSQCSSKRYRNSGSSFRPELESVDSDGSNEIPNCSIDPPPPRPSPKELNKKHQHHENLSRGSHKACLPQQSLVKKHNSKEIIGTCNVLNSTDRSKKNDVPLTNVFLTEKIQNSPSNNIDSSVPLKNGNCGDEATNDIVVSQQTQSKDIKSIKPSGDDITTLNNRKDNHRLETEPSTSTIDETVLEHGLVQKVFNRLPDQSIHETPVKLVGMDYKSSPVVPQGTSFPNQSIKDIERPDSEADKVVLIPSYKIIPNLKPLVASRLQDFPIQSDHQMPCQSTPLTYSYVDTHSSNDELDTLKSNQVFTQSPLENTQSSKTSHLETRFTPHSSETNCQSSQNHCSVDAYTSNVKADAPASNQIYTHLPVDVYDRIDELSDFCDGYCSSQQDVLSPWTSEADTDWESTSRSKKGKTSNSRRKNLQPSRPSSSSHLHTNEAMTVVKE